MCANEKNVDNILLSIIVPVYNAEKYLSRCIESLIIQTHKALEIILIDDGSQDNSSIICDDYKDRDERIKVIHQKNGGVSKARNVGLEYANGEYIAFVDSDDWVEPEMYEKLLQAALDNEADYVKCGFCHTDGYKKDYVRWQKIGIIENDDIMMYYFKGVLSVLVWNAIYRADLAKKVSYPDGMGFEDNYVCFFYLFYAKRLVLTPYTDYNYFYNDNGLSSKVKSEDKFKLTERLRQDIKCKNIKIKPNIQKEMDFIWAKDWFHRIRDNNIDTVDDNILQSVCKILDIRRSIQLRLILLKRKLLG